MPAPGTEGGYLQFERTLCADIHELVARLRGKPRCLRLCASGTGSRHQYQNDNGQAGYPSGVDVDCLHSPHYLTPASAVSIVSEPGLMR